MTVHCVSWVILKYLDVGPVPAWLPSPAWGQAGLRASSTLPLRQYVSKQDKCLSQCKRAMEKWKRKGYYDRMEIIVSNFKLDSSEKGVWERVGRGERKKKKKNYSFCAHVWKEGKTFAASVMKFKCWDWFTGLWISVIWLWAALINWTTDCDRLKLLLSLNTSKPLPLCWPPDNHIPHWELKELKECLTQHKAPVAEDGDQRREEALGRFVLCAFETYTYIHIYIYVWLNVTITTVKAKKTSLHCLSWLCCYCLCKPHGVHSSPMHVIKRWLPWLNERL